MRTVLSALLIMRGFIVQHMLFREITAKKSKMVDKISSLERKNRTGYEFGMFIKESGEYIGNIGIVNISSAHNRGDITYFINPELWGQGFATEGGRAMLKLAFESLRLNRLAGCCMSCNGASRRVMEKLGLKYEGTARSELLKDGVYYDIDRLGMLSQDYFS